jgi:alkylation response protein AidB-like acyl-CoA dehydrogenase
VHLDLTADEAALRDELRAYFAGLMTDDIRARLGGAEGGALYRSVVGRIGKDGWLGIGWPKEYGGQGRSAMDQFLFFDEAMRAGAPVPFVTLNTVGPTLIAFGTDDQNARFLPGILAGETIFAIGYTEPEAGTDLASLRTRAVRDGEEYVVNGSKIFTSGADDADFVFLAVRTNPDAPKHKGISILLVPTTSPGFKVTPITTVGDLRTTATFYDDVRVPVANRVGEEDAGWRLITTQLNHERVGLAAFGAKAFRHWDEVATWAAATPSGEPGGGTMLDLPWVRADLARTYAKLEAMKVLNWRMVADVGAGTLRAADASAVKVYGTETVVDVYRTLLGILGPVGSLRAGSPGARLRGEVERAGRAAQINTFGGGVNEVQREIVAAAGLGMARRAR